MGIGQTFMNILAAIFTALMWAGILLLMYAVATLLYDLWTAPPKKSVDTHGWLRCDPPEDEE
jgi:hypothetical protein